MGFERTGFFHFVHNHAFPMCELQSALNLENSNKCVRNSLVVLPEAFNIGKSYKATGDCNYDPAILPELMCLSRTFHVTFIAGLIIREDGGPDPPYNSAYLIDETCSVLLCRKSSDDGNGENTPYTRCEHGYDPHNPIGHNGIGLVTLICLDTEDKSRKETLLNGSDSPKIICIPACMAGFFDLRAIAFSWQPHDVILANSDPMGIGSFVRKNGVRVEETGRDHNKLILI